jgi:hypothetical protein
MHESRPVRWIAEAEARRVCERALLQRAPSEPHVPIVEATSRRGWVRRTLITFAGASGLVAVIRLAPNRWWNGI